MSSNAPIDTAGLGTPGIQSVLCRIAACLALPLLALEHWRLRQQVEMQLAHIDARTLRDAGISEAQRFLGVNKPG